MRIPDAYTGNQIAPALCLLYQSNSFCIRNRASHRLQHQAAGELMSGLQKTVKSDASDAKLLMLSALCRCVGSFPRDLMGLSISKYSYKP